ncbi:hypothetical protein PR048_004543 [Dryococelus australis]|uniref:DDE Tnp4 domain-containing protein n=1 Tax=Dryococelus australis TaxID=614101 RepID=A0ABQ9I5P9_9NEOP|nr:hypothetical protein PR048_004543 [Dryococelus australis]
MDLYRRKRVAFAYLVYKYVSSKRHRRYLTHPLVSNYFRESSKAFDELATKLEASIKSNDTVMRLGIPPIELLAVTLSRGEIITCGRGFGCSLRRFLGFVVVDTGICHTWLYCLQKKRQLASIDVSSDTLSNGCTLVELHYEYRIGRSTLCKIVRRVCKAVWTIMHTECIPMFSEERWLENSQGFQNRANFPNCVGALDVKHVRIAKPASNGSEFFNYKKYYSVVLSVISDANYLFNYVEVGVTRQRI